METKDQILDAAVRDIESSQGVKLSPAARVVIGLALKKQARNTRHACAEAVLQCPDLNEHHCRETDRKIIDADVAHAACMSVSEL